MCGSGDLVAMSPLRRNGSGPICRICRTISGGLRRVIREPLACRSVCRVPTACQSRAKITHPNGGKRGYVWDTLGECIGVKLCL